MSVFFVTMSISSTVRRWVVAGLKQTNPRNAIAKGRPSPYVESVADASERVVCAVDVILKKNPNVSFHDLEEQVWAKVGEASIWYNNSQTIDTYEKGLKKYKYKLAQLSVAQIQSILQWKEKACAALGETENDTGASMRINQEADDLIDLTASVLIANHDYVEKDELVLHKSQCTDLLQAAQHLAAGSEVEDVIQGYSNRKTKAWDLRKQFLLNKSDAVNVDIIGFGPTGGLLANLLKQNSSTSTTIYESRNKEVSMQECLDNGVWKRCYAERWQYLTNKCSSFLRFAVGEGAWERMLRETEVVFFGADVNNREFAKIVGDSETWTRHTGTGYAPETIRASTGTLQWLMLQGLAGFNNVSSHFSMHTSIDNLARKNDHADVVVLTTGCGSKLDRDLKKIQDLCPKLNVVINPHFETYGVTGMLIEHADDNDLPGYGGEKACGENWAVERTAVRPEANMHMLTKKIARHITMERNLVASGQDVRETYNHKHCDDIRDAALQWSHGRCMKLRYFLSKCDHARDIENPREAARKYIEERFDLPEGGLWAFSAFKAAPRLVENPINVDEYLESVKESFFSRNSTNEAPDVPLIILAGDTAANAHPLSGHGQDGSSRMSRQIDTMANTMTALRLLQDHPRADILDRQRLFDLLETQLRLTNEALQATNKTIFLNHLISALYTNRQLLVEATSGKDRVHDVLPEHLQEAY